MRAGGTGPPFYLLVMHHMNGWFWPQGVVRLVIHSTAAADPKRPLSHLPNFLFMVAAILRKTFLFASLLAFTSCYAENKEQAIFDFINQGEPEQALSVLSLSQCEQYLEACASLSTGLLQYEPHIDTGKRYLKRAADGGHARAKVVLGSFLIEGNVFDQDPAAGIALLEQAVELGASEGMFYLANEYYKGVNLEKDDSRALELYARASEIGHIYAPYNAGVVAWELHQNCELTEKYFALGAPYTDDALRALEEIRTQEPCASVLAGEQD